MLIAPGSKVTLDYPRQAVAVTSYFEHDEFCNTRQVVDLCATSLVEPHEVW